jgi:hypothetical protein
MQVLSLIPTVGMLMVHLQSAHCQDCVQIHHLTTALCFDVNSISNVDTPIETG